MGEPDKEPVLTLDQLSSSIRYKEMGITFWLIEPGKKIDGINLDFSRPTKGLLVPYKIIKFRKAAYSLDSDLNEFIKF